MTAVLDALPFEHFVRFRPLEPAAEAPIWMGVLGPDEAEACAPCGPLSDEAFGNPPLGPADVPASESAGAVLSDAPLPPIEPAA